MMRIMFYLILILSTGMLKAQIQTKYVSLSTGFSLGKLIEDDFETDLVTGITNVNLNVNLRLKKWKHVSIRAGLGYAAVSGCEKGETIHYIAMPITIQRFLNKNHQGLNASLVITSMYNVEGKKQYCQKTLTNNHFLFGIRLGNVFKSKPINIELEAMVIPHAIDRRENLKFVTYGFNISYFL